MVFDHWDHLMAFMIPGLELESQVTSISGSSRRTSGSPDARRPRDLAVWLRRAAVDVRRTRHVSRFVARKEKRCTYHAPRYCGPRLAPQCCWPVSCGLAHRRERLAQKAAPRS